MRKTLLFLAFFLSALVAHAKDLSLDEIRTTLLGQQIIVLGSAFNGYGSLSNSLVDWKIVTGDEHSGFYSDLRASSYAPVKIRGKRGQVIFVGEAQSSIKSNNVNKIDVFGKKIDESRVKNPYIYVVVKMDDDEILVKTEGYFGRMLGREMQLASRMDAMQKELDVHLARLIGKTLYKTGYTKLLDSMLSIQDLLDRNKREQSRDYITENLTPLKVIDAKFIEAAYAVAIKIELPNRETRILFGELDYDFEVGSKPVTLESMKISAVEKISLKFSPKEIAAIKNGYIFRGMSEDALRWSWGYAEKINDWGRGGKQKIYPGGQYVYVSGNVVRDWQSVN